MTTIRWLIDFDWDNDGMIESDERTRVTAVRVERGRGSPWEDFSAGKCVLTLENNDRRFDPWYSSSPLYPNVAPRRTVRVRVWRLGTTYPVFYGRIEEIEPMGQAGNRTVTITAYDGLREMSQATVDATLREGIRNDEAVTAVLDAIDWPAGDRDLDVSAQVMAYWWTRSGGSPRQRLDELARSEHGALFVDARGYVRFIGREGYTTGTVSWTLQQTTLEDVALTQPWASIFNGVNVKCYPVTVSSEAVLWSLQDRNLFLAAGESATIWAEYVDSQAQPCAADEVVNPVVATTDYAANSQADGSGDDLTGALAVTLTGYASRAKLVLENTGAASLFVTLLQVRGRAIVQTTVQVQAEHVKSQQNYGRRWLTIDVPWQQRVTAAQDLASALCEFYAEPRPSATVKMANVLPTMVDIELCDRVRLVVAEYGIDQLMHVQRITLETGRTMQELFGTFELAPAETQTSWLLEDATAGVLGSNGKPETGTTWLGY